MKRSRLVREIREAAASRGCRWVLVREGAEHEIWSCGMTSVAIPRHVEINDLSALRIRQLLQAELGQGWWR